MKTGMPLIKFLLEEERRYPNSTGQFTGLFSDLVLAVKIISHKVNMAGLINILGSAERQNIQGEEVQKLDELANEAIISTMENGGHLSGMASEECEGVIEISDGYPKGGYLLLFDPLDGSSNIDVNISVGTIFSIIRKSPRDEKTRVEDFLRPGAEQVAAGYVVYGPSTMLVYTTGRGVHGFTLDPGVGEFLLSHENIRVPERGDIYSVNEGNSRRWPDAAKNYVEKLKENGRCARYVGSLVADFHRNLLKGGIFLYPADKKNPKGKLRLLYEANPLSFVVEQAGGASTDGQKRILDITPVELHQRTPLIIGSKTDVEEATKAFSAASASV
ncbi:MAG TPA: class 1 fructose-bisphosphatase [Thermodesulfobacteriota bacterium]|nr:class 1 fructose-bisphosphatase [Thermodesulfobacteriota bacterium]